jgi:hypothetical protein
MTPASLLHFSASVLHLVTALLWCALLFLSIAGYGAILLRLFRLRRPSIALAATSGVGVVIFLGGCLNLLHAITIPILLTLIVLGLLAAILLRITVTEPEPQIEAGNLQPPSSRTVTLLLLLLALLFLARLGASVHAGQYQASDDYNFYLAAPLKMQQLHHYAADPFSERRIMTSIGGSYFLQTMVLAALPLANVQMADRTLGLLLLAFMAYGLANEFRLTRVQSLVLPCSSSSRPSSSSTSPSSFCPAPSSSASSTSPPTGNPSPIIPFSSHFYSASLPELSPPPNPPTFPTELSS